MQTGPEPRPLERTRGLRAAATGSLLALVPAAAALGGCGAPVGVASFPWKKAFEILVFFLLVFFVFRFMRGTRGEGILKGVIAVVLAGFFALLTLAQQQQLERLELVLRAVLNTSVIALIIIFQPELRRGLVRIGESSLARLFVKSNVSVVSEIVESVVRLSKKKVGALIAIEREIGLRTYIEGGVKIDAEVRSELIDTIFYPGTALHDGAIVIQGNRIAAAGCLFPLTDNPTISKTLGTRHRAAIGLTEETDAITIVVSEETGQISVGVDGELHRNLDKDQLETLLRRLIVSGEVPAHKARPKHAAAAPAPAGAAAATAGAAVLKEKEKELVR